MTTFSAIVVTSKKDLNSIYLYHTIMKKRLILVGLIFVFMVSLVLAEEESANVFLTLKDINTQEDIDNVVVYLDIDGQNINQYVSDNEILKLKLDDGKHNLVITVDNLSTKGKDYLRKQIFLSKIA